MAQFYTTDKLIFQKGPPITTQSAKAELLKLYPDAVCKRMAAIAGAGTSIITGYGVYLREDDKKPIRTARSPREAWEKALRAVEMM